MTSERPSNEQLRAYMLGNVSADDQVAIAAYLEAHPEVISQLQVGDLDSDSLVSDLRHPADEFTGEPQFWKGLEQARSIRLGPSIQSMSPPDGEHRSFPHRIGSYVLQERISRRGLGIVYRAVADCSGESVVIKLLPVSRMDDPSVSARFRREMELLGKLQHPHIVRFVDSGESDGTLFLVMEYLKGFDLSRLVELLGPLPVSAACSMVRQTALALQHAFENRLVHRDVKPSNIFLTEDGVIKMLDLGLARPLSVDEDSLTHSGQLLGTVDYMAPEQAFDTHQADIRSDIYSLGCTLYKLLVGNAPFSGPEYRHLLKKALAHSSRPMTPVRDRRPDVPVELASVIERMCAKSPEDRFGSPQQVAEALISFADDTSLSVLVRQAATLEETKTPRQAEPTQRITKATTKRRSIQKSRRSVSIACVVILVLLGAVIAGWWTFRGTENSDRDVGRVSGVQPSFQASTGATRTGKWRIVGSGDFESGMAGWPAQAPDDPRDKGLFEQSAEKAFDGRHSACSLPIATFDLEGFACISDEYPLDIGRKYVLSAAFETSGMTAGNLAVDLSDSGFNVRVNALPGIKGWQFLWAEFVPNTKSIRVRIIRDGRLIKGEKGFIDCVAITPADDFTPASEGMVVSAKQPLAARESFRIVQDSPYSRVWCLSVSANGSVAYTGSNDGILRKWNLKKREKDFSLRQSQPADQPIHALAFSPEENHCLTVGSPSYAKWWKLTDRREERSFDGHTDRVWTASLSPDGSRVVTGSWDGTIRIFDIATGQSLRTIDPQIGKVLAVAYSPNGKWIAAGGRAMVLLLDADTGERIRPFDGHKLYVNALAFTSDSQFLVTGARDNTVRLWNVADGQEVRRFNGHAGWVNAVAVSPNNRLLLTASADRSVRLWDLATGEPLRLYLGHEASVNAVAFVPNRPEAVSGGDDRTIRVWPLPGGTHQRD